MPRPLIGPQQATDAPAPLRSKAFGAAGLDARLRERRHSTFMDAMAGMDASTAVDAQAHLQALLDAASAEFGDVGRDQIASAIVAACTVNEGYEVHVLDLSLKTAVHYRKNEPLPGGLDRVRRMAMHPDYAFVEVYDGTARGVKRDGSVTVVKLA